MKTFTVILFIAILLISCKESQVKTKPINERFQELKIDSCEYIVSNIIYGSNITHKGNCSNPIHKNNSNYAVSKDKDLSEICSNCTNDIIEEYYDSASMAAGYFRSVYKNSNLKSFKYYLNKADSIKWDLKRKIGCYDN